MLVAKSGSNSALYQSALYLDAAIKQSIGEAQAALACYRSPELMLPEAPTKFTSSDIEYRVLATMNSITILRQFDATQAEAERLLEQVEPYCANSQNPSMLAAANILRATTSKPNTIIKTKSHLSMSLKAAKEPKNHQLLAIAMSIMVSSFFTNIVGDQADKSANVAVTLSERLKSPLWIGVSGGMLSRTHKLHGRKEAAQATLDEAHLSISKMPESLKARLADGGV